MLCFQDTGFPSWSQASGKKRFLAKCSEASKRGCCSAVRRAKESVGQASSEWEFGASPSSLHPLTLFSIMDIMRTIFVFRTDPPLPEPCCDRTLALMASQNGFVAQIQWKGTGAVYCYAHIIGIVFQTMLVSDGIFLR